VEWSLVLVALTVLAVASVSRLLVGTPVTPAMVFVAVGVLLGPRILGEVEPSVHGETVRTLAEATLALVLFADASRIKLGVLRRQAGVPVRLLAVGLPLTIVLGALAAGLFNGMTVGEALVLGVLLAPTDAALGQAVVTLPALPSRIRQGLNVESGLNDGVCVPLLIIFLSVAEAHEGVGSIDPLKVVAEEIGYGALAGLGAGVIGALVLRTFVARGWMSGSW
jgi:sodium/hydrogen antiporter